MWKLVLLGAAVVLSGCVSAVTETAHVAKNRSVYNSNIDKAQRGDPVAQFKIGEALCCSVDEGNNAFYNTRNAVGWLCASAIQGYAPAMYKIGKIYNGDVVDGLRVARRVAQGMAGNSTNLPVSYTWFAHAAVRGDKDARSEVDKLWTVMTPAQQAETRRLVDQGLNATCRWEDAILSTR